MKITKEVKTGFVVIATLVAFYGLFNYLKGKNLFSAGNTYYIKYDHVGGLAPSKPVTVNGLRIGKVDEIKIVTTAQPIYFVATIKLDKKLDFSLNTLAQIHEPGMMSGPEIQLLLDYNGQMAQNGDTLQGSLKVGLMDSFAGELEPTKRKADSLLVSLNTTAANLNKLLDDETQASLKKTIKSLDVTLNSFTQTSNSANQLINDNNVQLKSTLTSTQKAIDKYSQVADKINNLELEKIIQNFEEVSAELNQTLANINNSKGTLGALLNDRELYDNLTQTAKSLDELLADMKENPNRYVQFSIFGKKQVQTKVD